MTKLNNFPQKSIEELLEFDNGVTKLFHLFLSEPLATDYISPDTRKGLFRVLKIQEDAQEALGLRIKEKVTEFEFEERGGVE